MKVLLWLILVSSIIFAQYTKDDNTLVKNTFTKAFDKSILNNYFNSNNPQKIKAVLLSVSHSEDTTWVTEIIKLNFNSFAEEICFTLGQLGECSTSTLYLKEQLRNCANELVYYCLVAIGKTGSKNDAESIIYNYLNQDNYVKFDGISKCIVNFFSRGIKLEQFDDVLMSELEANPIPFNRKIDALFAFYRIGVSKRAHTYLASLINNLPKNLSSNDSITFFQYALGCLRKANETNFDSSLFSKLVTSSNWLLREEAAKLLVHNKNWNKSSLDYYLSLLQDKNPNVSRQTAISIKEIKVDSTLNIFLKQELEYFLYKVVMPPNTKGELLLSYVSLFKPKLNPIVEEFEQRLPMEFLYRVIGDNPKLYDFPYGYLEKNYKIESKKNLMFVMDGIMNLQTDYDSLPFFSQFLVDNISSKNFLLAAVVAEKLSERIINNKKLLLKNKILNLVDANKNNTDFSEVASSIYSLSERIDSSFAQTIVNLLEQSSIYSIKKFAYQKQGKDYRILIKPGLNFDNIWNYAFKYKNAFIQTNKGSFTIEFIPSYAPVTVGSFCYLAAQAKFDGNIFHRVVPGFVIQTGDPTGTGWCGPGYEIVSEFSHLSYSTGYVGMASSGKDTEGSQWFVMQANHPHLDGRYTIFGKVTNGLETVFNIDQNDEILSITLIEN